ncbi:MAG TPA: c-type cytochrome [Dissulfurispiraceae bacterium]|nr:c-type cytochrome [Dissulfurispiraceae bacterium]
MKKTVIISFMIFLIFIFAGIALSEDAQKKNPYAGNAKIATEGSEIFKINCQTCHGVGGKGDICPNLTTKSKKYGDSDQDLFLTISKGRPGGMPNWDNALGADRIWKVITYIRSIEK